MRAYCWRYSNDPAISGPDDHGVSNPARSRHGLRRLSHASRTASPRPHPGARRSLSYRDAASRNLWNPDRKNALFRSEEHTSELQSLMRISYAVFGFKNKKNTTNYQY